MTNLKTNTIRLLKTLSIKRLAIVSFVLGVSATIVGYAQAATDINYKTTVKDASGTKVETGKDSTANLTKAQLDPAVKDKAASAQAGAQKVAEDATKTAEADAKDVNYSGLYNGKEIVPNVMAIYCKTNAEEFLQDPTKMDKCIQKYIAAMNSRNAAAREEGLEDYNNLALKVLMKMMSEAVAKGASTANYDDVANKTAEKTSQTETIHEDGAGISYTTSLSTDVINRLRELSVTTLFWQVVQGMRFVDPSIIDEEIRAEAESQADKYTITDNSADKSQNGQLNVSSEASLNYGDNTYNSGDDEDYSDEEYDEEPLEILGTYDPSSKQCTVNGVKGVCADGTYKTGDQCIECYGGNCTATVCESAVVEAKKIEKNASEATEILGTYDPSSKQCMVNGVKGACTDGTYKMGDQCIECYGGNCTATVCESAVVEAKKTSSNVAAQYPTPWNGQATQTEQAPAWNNMYPNNTNNNIQVPYRPADQEEETVDEFASTFKAPDNALTAEQIRENVYSSVIKGWSRSDIDAEMNKQKTLMEEYKAYKAEKADGNSWEPDARQLEEWQDASKKYQMLLDEAKSRR